MILPLLNI